MEAVASAPPLASQSPGANGDGPPAFIAIDPSLVVDYLVSIITITLGATRADLESPGSLLSKANYTDTLQRCTRFASDVQVALYIQKETVPTSPELPDGPVDNCELLGSRPSSASLPDRKSSSCPALTSRFKYR